MTLTTPHCPVAESMPGEVELRVSSVPGVRDAEVNLVWDPPQKMGHGQDERMRPGSNWGCCDDHCHAPTPCRRDPDADRRSARRAI
jgi:hypothetical protein